MSADRYREVFLINDICEKKMSSRKRSYTKVEIVEDNEGNHKVCENRG